MSPDEQNDLRSNTPEYPAAVQSLGSGGFSRGFKRFLLFALLVLFAGSCVITALRVLPILRNLPQRKPTPNLHYPARQRS